MCFLDVEIDEKYRYQLLGDGSSYLMRHGVAWRDVTGDKALYSMAFELNETRQLNKRMAERLIDVGVCPDCMEEVDHHIDEPFSSCSCGTGEDYGERPLQALQILKGN